MNRTQGVAFLNSSQAMEAVAAANPLPVALSAVAGGVTPTDAAVLTVTAGGTSQTVFAANAARRWLLIQNISDSAMWVNFGAAAAASQPSILIAAGGYLEPLVAPTTSVTLFCATTGKAFTAKEA